jgi:hemerythrin-like domain-containing protein
MHPTDTLSHEHRRIEAMLDSLDSRIAAVHGGAPFDRALFETALDFFRDFADGCHHAKEEKLLFPKMAALGMPAHTGPIGVMLAEHEQGRAFLRTVRANLDSAGTGSAEALDRALAAAAGYSQLLRQHIYKEDNILFRMARTMLQPADVAELERHFLAVEVPERYRETDSATA